MRQLLEKISPVTNGEKIKKPRFDVKVTMIQRSPHVLKEFDTDSAAVVEKVFRRKK